MYYVHGEYYDKTVEPFNSYDRITAFIPTKEAIGRIPKEKLDLLRNNPAQLKEVSLHSNFNCLGKIKARHKSDSDQKKFFF